MVLARLLNRGFIYRGIILFTDNSFRTDNWSLKRGWPFINRWLLNRGSTVNGGVG